MSKPDARVYLGKKGKIFGPFTTQEIRDMQAKGGLETYSYLWDPTSESWRPLEPPPPAPVGATAASAIRPDVTDAPAARPGVTNAPASRPGVANAPASRPVVTDGLSGCEVICYDSSQQLVSGTLRKVSEQGCELITKDHCDSPRFGLHSAVVLSLLDPKNQKAINVRALLASALFLNGAWIYELNWDGLPAL